MRKSVSYAIRNKKAFLSGLLVILVLYHATLILNVDMKEKIHDEFDGEFLTYIYQTSHLGEETLPELFNGTINASMLPPAPSFMLVYMIFDSRTAFFVCFLIIVISAYLGMYLCIDHLVRNTTIAAFTGVCFSLLPFYSVYGLSVMGQPILLYALYGLWEDQNMHNWKYLILILFVTVSSSLVLIGYADIILLLVIILYGIYKKRKIRWFIISWILMTLVYIIENIPLVYSIVGNSNGFISHRTEYVVSHSSFFQNFSKIFFIGKSHAASCHTLLVPWCVGIFIWSSILERKKRVEYRCNLSIMRDLLLSAIGIATFYALWHCEPVTTIRNSIGGIFISFQMDRFYWFNPTIWFVLFGYSLYFLKENCVVLHIWKYGKVICFTFSSVLMLYIFSTSTAFVNAKALYNHEEHIDGYASVDDFYQPGLFEEINDYIGLPKGSYRTVSIGLYPSIPLYNGFYCLDGYSNNYNLSYKHEFREIIAGELEKSDELRKNFDEWGNRCYVFSSEISKRYYVGKDENYSIDQLDLNYDKLKEMGCKYVLSGVTINDEHLRFECEFSSTDSYYKVLLYSVL